MKQKGNENTNKFAFFNLLRFFGAILIAVFLHYYDHFLPYLDGRFWFKEKSFAQFLAQNSYVFVEMFFMISGILFYHHYLKKIEDGETIDGFIKKRYKRIFPLVIISSIFMFLANMIYFKKFDLFYSCGQLSLMELTFDIVFAGTLGFGPTNPINGPLWYIGPLMVCYLIAFFLTKLSKKLKTDLVFLIPIIIGSFIFLRNINFFLLNQNMARGLIAFFIGVLIFNKKIINYIDNMTIVKKIIFRIIMVLIISAFVLVNISSSKDLFMNDLFGTLFSYIVYFFIPLFYLLYDIKWFNKICDTKFIKYLGNISFSIYIWNFPIMIVLTYIIKAGMITMNFESWKFIVLFFVIHIIVGTISYYCIEKKIKNYFDKKSNN